jgi:hypothetical protein
MAMDVGCTFAVLPAADFSKTAAERRAAVKIALNLDKQRAWRAGCVKTLRVNPACVLAR